LVGGSNPPWPAKNQRLPLPRFHALSRAVYLRALAVRAMSKRLQFLLEKSRTPIYQRIVENFQNALVDCGHTATIVDPADARTIEEYVVDVKRRSPDYYFITNALVRIGEYVDHLNAYAFELIDTPLVFIHHDSLFWHLRSLDDIRRGLNAYLRLNERSYHFFIDSSHLQDFRSLGVSNAYQIFHASEFTTRKDLDAWKHDVSFIGHVLPRLGADVELEQLPPSHRLRADFWQRLVRFDYRMGPSGEVFADLIDAKTPVSRLSAKSFYGMMIHLHSLCFRGEVLRRLDATVSVVGGDPTYLKTGEEHTLTRFDRPNIRMLPPTKIYSDARDIYAHSGINLNITSLQFDDAVINRVMDASASGGFILTDWKDSLRDLTSVADRISYKSIEELNYKIAYYLDPANDGERTELIHQLRSDLRKSCTYPAVAESILEGLAGQG
jgi:hypothetical protein